MRDLLEHQIGVVATSVPPPPADRRARSRSPLTPQRNSRRPRRRDDGMAARPACSTRSSSSAPARCPGRVLAGINLLDTATHTWDMATATGQPATLPDDVALAALEASKTIVSPSFAKAASVPRWRHPTDATRPSASSPFWGGRRDRGHERRHPRGVGTTAD